MGGTGCVVRWQLQAMWAVSRRLVSGHYEGMSCVVLHFGRVRPDLVPGQPQFCAYLQSLHHLLRLLLPDVPA